MIALSRTDPAPTLAERLDRLERLLAAITATAQTWLADQRGGDFAFAMSAWIAAVAVLLAFLTWLGPEARGRGFGRDREAA